MGRILVVFTLGLGLFAAGGFYFGLFDETTFIEAKRREPIKEPLTAIKDLGGDLYADAGYAKIETPTRGYADRIVLRGVMNAFEQEEVPAQAQGRVLFLGDQVDDGAVMVAGSAPFLAEPYYFATVYTGRQSYVKFYRRLYDGEKVQQGQMLGMIDPSKALGGVLEKIAKISAAMADERAAIAGEEEGLDRLQRAQVLFNKGVMNREDYGAAKLTAIKLQMERVSAREKVKLAEVEKDISDIELKMHEIRAVLPYKHYTVKTILRQSGSYIKQLDPAVVIVQNLERLQAEALIEGQYYTRLKDQKQILGTIEPTILESPEREFPGHTADVTSVAVAKDLKIVSGSEDMTVCVWKQDLKAPLRTLDHESAVKVVACTPTAADRNICLAGCADGRIYVWDLDRDDVTPIAIVRQRGEAAVTSLAFSPDGAVFASGGSDGMIQIWNTADAKEKYAFVRANGVEVCHEDAVTSLHFTPQCRLISAGRDKTLRVWQLKEKGAVPDGRALSFRDGKVGQLGVTANGQYMIFDMNNSLRLLSVESKKLIHTLNIPANSQPFDTFAIFSPDGSLILTAGAPEGRMQLWRVPDANHRGFEVRQFATRDKDRSVTCAALAPDAGKGGAASFAVSASGPKIYLWSIPGKEDVENHCIRNVRMTVIHRNLDASTNTTRIGFEVANPITERYPNGRFEAGRPVTIVIE